MSPPDRDKPLPSSPTSFVIARHAFTPDDDPESCLRLPLGAVIRVFNRDPSGWWDGELDGRRGWFPSNYVNDVYDDDDVARIRLEIQASLSSPTSTSSLSSPPPPHASLSDHQQQQELYHHPHPPHHDGGPQHFLVPDAEQELDIQQHPQDTSSDRNSSTCSPCPPSPLQATVAALDLLRSAAHARRTAHLQPATACVVASLRSLLAAADCLARTSPTLEAYPNLADHRHLLLSALSQLVTHSRRASPIHTRDAADETRAQLDNFVLAAKRLNIPLEQPTNTPDDDQHPSSASFELTPRPPHSSSLEQNYHHPHLHNHLHTHNPHSLHHNNHHLHHNNDHSYHHHNSSVASSSSSSSSPPPPQPLPPPPAPAPPPPYSSSSSPKSPRFDIRPLSPATRHNRAQQHQHQHQHHHQSLTPLSSPTSSTAPLNPSSSSPAQVSFTPKELIAYLGTLHDNLLSTIAALVGHVHAHSRSSPASSYAHLIDATRDVILHVRKFLLPVEAVASIAARPFLSSPSATTATNTCSTSTSSSSSTSPIFAIPPSPSAAFTRLAQTRRAELNILLRSRESLYQATTSLVTAARIATIGQSGKLKGDKRIKEIAKRKAQQDGYELQGRKEGDEDGDDDDDDKDDDDADDDEDEEGNDSEDEERTQLLKSATEVLRAAGDCQVSLKMALVMPPVNNKSSRSKKAAAAAASIANNKEEDIVIFHLDLSKLDLISSSEEAEAQTAATDAVAFPGSEDATLASPSMVLNTHTYSATLPTDFRRGRRTISMLGRKATSLGCLRDRYEQDHAASRADDGGDEQQQHVDDTLHETELEHDLDDTHSHHDDGFINNNRWSDDQYNDSTATATTIIGQQQQYSSPNYSGRTSTESDWANSSIYDGIHPSGGGSRLTDRRGVPAPSPLHLPNTNGSSSQKRTGTLPLTSTSLSTDSSGNTTSTFRSAVTATPVSPHNKKISGRAALYDPATPSIYSAASTSSTYVIPSARSDSTMRTATNNHYQAQHGRTFSSSSNSITSTVTSTGSYVPARSRSSKSSTRKSTTTPIALSPEQQQNQQQPLSSSSASAAVQDFAHALKNHNSQQHNRSLSSTSSILSSSSPSSSSSSTHIKSPRKKKHGHSHSLGTASSIRSSSHSRTMSRVSEVEEVSSELSYMEKQQQHQLQNQGQGQQPASASSTNTKFSHSASTSMSRQDSRASGSTDLSSERSNLFDPSLSSPRSSVGEATSSSGAASKTSSTTAFTSVAAAKVASISSSSSIPPSIPTSVVSPSPSSSSTATDSSKTTTSTATATASKIPSPKLRFAKQPPTSKTVPVVSCSSSAAEQTDSSKQSDSSSAEDNNSNNTKQQQTIVVQDEDKDPRAALLERDYEPREIAFSSDGRILGGTLKCLVERMTLHDSTIDPTFSHAFFFTFRMFTTPMELFLELVNRFQITIPSYVHSPSNNSSGNNSNTVTVPQLPPSSLSPAPSSADSSTTTYSQQSSDGTPLSTPVTPVTPWSTMSSSLSMSTMSSSTSSLGVNFKNNNSDAYKLWHDQKVIPVRLRVYNVFKTWLESHWRQQEDSIILEPLAQFTKDVMATSMTASSQRLYDLIQRRQQNVLMSPATPGTAGLSPSGIPRPSGMPSPIPSISSPLASSASTSSSSASPATPASSTQSPIAAGLRMTRIPSVDRLRPRPDPITTINSPTISSLASPMSNASPALQSPAFSITSSSSGMPTPSQSPTGTGPQPILSKSLMNALRNNPSASQISVSSSSSATTSSNSGVPISITDIDPLELARQLTIMESKAFCGIQPEELMNADFGKKNAQYASPNVRAMTSMSTRLTGWIAETILSEQDTKRRTALVKFFIKVADRCLSINNYNTLVAIVAALNSSTIARLRKTWDGMSSKYRTLLETLRAATEHSRNYSQYRARLRSTVPPCLPFLGLYLTDLTFVHEGNPTLRNSPLDSSLKLINFDKFFKITRIIDDIQRFQIPYSLVKVPELQNFLRSALANVEHGGDVNALYRRSLLVEPRETPAESSTSSVYPNDNSKIFNWRGL